MARARGALGRRLAARDAGDRGDARGAPQPEPLAVLGRARPRGVGRQRTRRARDTRPSCPPTTGTQCCRLPGSASASPRRCSKSSSTSDAIDELAREPALLRTRELLLCDLAAEAATEWRIAVRAADTGAAGPGDRARRSLGLAPPVDRRGGAAVAVQRLSAALSAAVRQGGACCGPPHRTARGAHLRGDPAGKPVSRRRRLERRSARADAAAADDRATRGAALGPQGAGLAPICSGRRSTCR